MLPKPDGKTYTVKRRKMKSIDQATSSPIDVAKQHCLQADDLSKASLYHLAIRLYDIAVLLASSDKELHSKILSHCAFAYCSIELFDKAINFCNKAIELNPRYAAAYNNRACTLFKKDPKTNSWGIIQDLKVAIDLSPKSKTFLDNLGWALQNPDIYQTANKYFTDILHLVDWAKLPTTSKTCHQSVSKTLNPSKFKIKLEHPAKMHFDLSESENESPVSDRFGSNSPTFQLKLDPSIPFYGYVSHFEDELVPFTKNAKDSDSIQVTHLKPVIETPIYFNQPSYKLPLHLIKVESQTATPVKLSESPTPINNDIKPNIDLSLSSQNVKEVRSQLKPRSPAFSPSNVDEKIAKNPNNIEKKLTTFSVRKSKLAEFVITSQHNQPIQNEPQHKPVKQLCNLAHSSTTSIKQGAFNQNLHRPEAPASIKKSPKQVLKLRK